MYMASRTLQRGVGKPRTYPSEEALAEAIEAYFDRCDSRIKTFVDKDGNETTALVPEPYTVSGLGYAIGMDRAQLIEYGNNELYHNTIKSAKRRIEADLERRLLETSNQTGVIFALKNNNGWRDQTEQTVTNKGEQTVIYRPEKLPEEAIEGEVVRDTRGITEQKSIEGK